MRVSGMTTESRVRLSPEDRAELEGWVAGRNTPQKLVWRARIVLMWADGAGLAKILQTTGKTKRTAYRWRDRYLARVRRAAILWATDLQTGTGVKGAAR
jgi:hypothetical protein